MILSGNGARGRGWWSYSARSRSPAELQRVGLGIEHIVVQTNGIRRGEYKVEIFEGFSQPKALYTVVSTLLEASRLKHVL